MLMCIVYGTRLPAGMFIPSLAGALSNLKSITQSSNVVSPPSVGALVGRMIGFAMEMLQSEVGDTGFFSS